MSLTYTSSFISFPWVAWPPEYAIAVHVCCQSCAYAHWWYSVCKKAEAGFHARVLMKVVRWRPSYQTQKHFTRLHLSWLSQFIACEGEIRATSHFTAQCPCSCPLMRLFNWDAIPHFDKDIEVRRLQLRAFIITFAPPMPAATELKWKAINLEVSKVHSSHLSATGLYLL